MAEKLYKVLDRNGGACFGGTGTWSLPMGDEPGEWMPEITKPRLCKRGYHLCRPNHLVIWLGPAIYEAEVRSFCQAAAGYLNHGITGQDIERHVRNCQRRQLDIAAAKTLIARRGNLARAMA